MVKIRQFSDTDPFLVSDVFGLTKERGDEIAKIMDDNLVHCRSVKTGTSTFVQTSIEKVDPQTDEEQAFVFWLLGSVLS